jgi:cyclopropane fatty-acyl-phospholipid synthase-like methyltransferase
VDLDQARYAQMRWNAPLSGDHAEVLLERLDLGAAGTVLDLGCGWGELLIAAVQAGAVTTTGVGVDIAPDLLERGRDRAAQAGLADRVRFVEQSAESWSEQADRVICIGATHAWGDTAHALQALTKVLAPGGRLLLGEGYWEQPPNEQAAEMFEGVEPMPALVALVRRIGWRVRQVTTADQAEWDAFESDYRGGREEWAAEHPDDPRAPDVQAELTQRLAEYLQIYRGVLGFCYLLLDRP